MTDKAAILSGAAHLVYQLHDEAQKLKDSNESLQEKIKELKVRFLFMLHILYKCSAVDSSFHVCSCMIWKYR